MRYMMGVECCEDEILSDAKSAGGSMRGAKGADLEQGYSVIERGSPKAKHMKEYFGMDESDCCDGGVLGRPNGFER